MSRIMRAEWAESSGGTLVPNDQAQPPRGVDTTSTRGDSERLAAAPLFASGFCGSICSAGFGFVGGVGLLWRVFIPSNQAALVELAFSFRTVMRILVWLAFLFERRWAVCGLALFDDLRNGD
jgi:hypothetical protein